MFEKNQKILLLISTFTIILSVFLLWKGINQVSLDHRLEPSPPDSDNKVLGDTLSSERNLKKFKVARVIDGDTIEVEEGGNLKKVRLIGVDTPETKDPRKPVQCFGKEAAAETERLLLGQEISMEKDISEVDKYGRLLRYVYLPLDDGNLLFVNDYLVRQGFAQTVTYPPDVKNEKKLLEAQIEARENLRGLWQSCPN